MPTAAIHMWSCGYVAYSCADCEVERAIVPKTPLLCTKKNPRHVPKMYPKKPSGIYGENHQAGGNIMKSTQTNNAARPSQHQFKTNNTTQHSTMKLGKHQRRRQNITPRACGKIMKTKDHAPRNPMLHHSAVDRLRPRDPALSGPLLWHLKHAVEKNGGQAKDGTSDVCAKAETKNGFFSNVHAKPHRVRKRGAPDDGGDLPLFLQPQCAASESLFWPHGS